MTAWAADLIPLPMSRLISIVPAVRLVPFVDQGLIDQAVARIHDLRDLDPFTNPESEGFSVIHGDATPSNIMVHEGQVSGLIDFEYSRMAPRDLELLSPVTFASGYGLTWLHEDYPRLFAGDDIRDRLWLYELCCALRQLIWWPPENKQHEGRSDHPPISRLRSLIDEPSHW